MDKTVQLARTMRSANPRGMSAFDFDETLIDEGQNFITATKDGETKKISSGQWPLQGPKLAADGWSFDFSDFVNVRGGVEGPLFTKFKERLAKAAKKSTGFRSIWNKIVKVPFFILKSLISLSLTTIYRIERWLTF